METESVWNKYLKDNYQELTTNISCDVLIIGGGLSGLLTAYYLRNTNLKVVVVERNTLASGVTSKMTAKVTLLQDILAKIKESDRDLYIKSQITGLKLLKKNIQENNIKCDFLESESYLYTTKKSNVSKLNKIQKSLEQNKIKTSLGNLEIANLNIKKSFKASMYVINPLKYLNGIVEMLDAKIYTKTNIIEVYKEDDNYISKTSTNQKIISKVVVFATNYPYFLKPLFFPLKVRLEKSYIAYGNTNLKTKDFNAINIDKDIKSIRFYKGKMIYATSMGNISHKTKNLKEFTNLQKEKILTSYDLMWTNMDIVTNDYLPISFEVYKGMYLLTGYNSWGILASHVASSIIASKILGQRKYLKYQALFNPRKKKNLQKVANSTLNIFENINGYFQGFLNKNKAVFYSKKHAMYLDFDGKCYFVKRKCPHLKCNLLFNEVEKTWDCPCHGSRFTLKGEVINGPSKYDIKVNDVK